MSALGAQTLINQQRSFYLSTIPTDIIHGTVVCDTIDASQANFSSLSVSDVAEISTLNASTLQITGNIEVSTLNTSSLFTNFGKFSTIQWVSNLAGGLGYVNITSDVSGVIVTGDPIKFNNLVYLTSTINIVQVSTIVDTDIFANNGYFSSISSGSISCGQASIENANISSLYVSSLVAFDLSGANPDQWSLYPTLNSSIIFQPGNVLSNVGNLLFFNGVELTDVSGGGQGWANFPALSTVQANNQSITGLSTLRFQDGGRLWSATGNNLFYNGQQIQFGGASNVSQWANFAAVNNVNMNTSSITNATLVSASNLALSGSNITNGNTFTNSLGVGGTSLISLATIDSGGDITCRNLQVGDSVTSLADVEIYGANALPADSALYVEGGVQFDGGNIHGFSAGLLPVAGINTGRIDMLQAGFNILHPAVGAITTGAALGITAGGAISIAAGSYIETNTGSLRMTNSTSGDQQTVITVGNILAPPSVAATSSLTIQNIAGGGVQIQGGGQGSLTGFSTLQSLYTSSVYLNVSTINGVAFTGSVPANIVCSNITVANQVITSTLGTTFLGAQSTFSQLGFISSLSTTSFVTAGMSSIRLSTGALSFSTATCVNSNARSTVGFFMDYDGAGNTSTSFGVIRVTGHNLGVLGTRKALTMGWRSSDNNSFIAAEQVGVSVEQLVLQGSPLQLTNTNISTFFASTPYAMVTAAPVGIGNAPLASYLSSGVISTNSLLVSSINSYNAIPAFANILQTSSMNLYQNSTTLAFWNSAPVISNISFSNYNITFQQNGTYKVGTSYQLNNTSGDDQVQWFFLKNNVALPNTASYFTVTNNTEAVAYSEIIQSFNSNDTLQMGLYTTSADVFLSTISSSVANVPNSPAAIATIFKIA